MFDAAAAAAVERRAREPAAATQSAVHGPREESARRGKPFGVTAGAHPPVSQFPGQQQRHQGHREIHGQEQL